MDHLQDVWVSVLTRPKVRGWVSSQTLRRRLRRLLRDPILIERTPSLCSVCLTLSDDEEVRALNRDYRGKDQPTDVLSFALAEGESLWTPPDIPVELGDIIISLDTAKRQMRRGALPRLSSVIGAHPWSLSDEVSFLALHGLLHLLGYDHVDEDEAEEMEALELKLLPTLLNIRRSISERS